MHLLFISSKPCWQDSSSSSGYSTVGGFPYQAKAISELFDRTTFTLLLSAAIIPKGSIPLIGHQIQFENLPEPKGKDFRRKVNLLTWLPKYFFYIWKAVRKVDAVHTPVPGDLGSIALVIALLQKKPVFVRHCGTWGEPVTISDRILLSLIERVAGGRTVVMATGGSDRPPSISNASVEWIFSTTLTEEEIFAMPQSQPWKPGETLHLVFVGRLSQNKNAAAVIQALPVIQQQIPKVHLHIAGEGSYQGELEHLVTELHLKELVTFYGNISHQEVLQLMARSHLFVFPTRVKEGFPKVVLEAMACGLPVIATPVSVIPHLIGNHNGIVLDGSDGPAVANAVLELAQDPACMAEMANHARLDSLQYTLENWRDLIGLRLQAAWGPLKETER